MSIEQTAKQIWDYLVGRGWTKEATAAVLGNMESESGIVADIWEHGHENDMNFGYGLVQWTPASKYIYWANMNGLVYQDVISQCKRLEWEVANREQFDHPSMSFQQFTQRTDSPEYLADIFIRYYERPANPNQPIRGVQARKWYELFKYDVPKINELGNITYFSRDDHMAIGVDFNPNQKGIVEFKMESYNLGTKQWKTIMDWNKANWGEWYDNKGDYWFHVKMRDGYTGVILAEKTISFAYKPGNARITAKNVSWQDERTILIGCTAFPSTAQIKVKLYNVNTQQWFQTFTGSWSSFVPDPNTSYVAKFEVYTAKGYLADESSYGFSGKK